MITTENAKNYYNHMKQTITQTDSEMGIEAAHRIADLIKEHNALGKRTVLGLATGKTPIPMYEELVRLHNEEGLDFSKVVTFNLDEHWQLPLKSKDSYAHYMDEHLFNHIDAGSKGIKRDNIHFLDKHVHEYDIKPHCDLYELQIEAAGGIDLQVLEIGTKGHLGFNEQRDSDPSYSLKSRTRMVDLSDSTIADNTAPTHKALTMGLGTIMEARELLVLASGEQKADIVAQTCGAKKLDFGTPAALLQLHPHCEMIVDKAAASKIQAAPPPSHSR